MDVLERAGLALLAPAVCAFAGVLLVHGRIVVAMLLALSLLAVGIVTVLRRPQAGVLAAVLLLSVFPIARVDLGPIPVYLGDVVSALVIAGLCAYGFSYNKFSLGVLVYLLLWLPAWVYEIERFGVGLEATYGLLRNVLAVSLFFGGFLIARSDVDLRRLIIVLAFGTAATGVIAVAQEAGPTAAAIRRLITTAAPMFDASYRVYPERAFAFFTAPTTLAGFLVFVIPLLLASTERAGARSHLLLVGASACGAIGLLVTYSRQWVPAAAVGLLLLGLIKPGRAGRILLGGSLVAAVVWILVGTGPVNDRYLSQRFHSLGLADPNVQTRIDRQKEFLSVARAQPIEMLVGHGFAGQDIVERNLVTQQAAEQLREGVSDNVFLLEVFNHGLFATLAYVTLLVVALRRAIIGARRPGPNQAVLSGLSAALGAIITLHFVDRYFSEAVFMKAFLWLLVGLIVGLTEKDAHPRERLAR